LSASEFRGTQKISVSNSAPTKNFSVGDKFHVSTTDVDAVNITGNLVAQKLKIGNLLVSPTFDLAAVSNVGNTTSNTLQFANATTGFTTTANVEIGGNITLTSNAQVKVGSNVLAEYTGPHGREPKEMPLKKFPEIAFDASKFDKNDTTNTYTQGGYTISTNAQYLDGNYAPWEMYVPGTGPLTGTHYWSSDSTQLYNAYWGGTLVGSPSAHYQTVVSSVTYNGVFTTIQLPHKIKLNSIDIQSHKDVYFPHSGIIAGSTDGSTWNLIHSFSELSTPDTPVIENIITNSAGNTNHYNYLRLIITKGGGNAYIGIRHLRWNGTEEPAPPGDLSLDTTLKSTFNSVRSNNYVMYFDGEDPAAGNVPKYLPSGSAKSITPHNAVFDTTNNCWTLDGSTESNVTTGSLGLVGDAPHTVSTWINASNLDANATTQQLFSIGSGYSEEIVRVDDTQIAANTWHNVTYAYQGEGGSKVTYVDGRKVEEAQVEDTFGEYPPFPMTGYKTSGYCVSASSDDYNANGFYAYKAFNDVQGDEGWHGGVGNGTTLHFTANAGGSVYDASISGGTSSPLSGNVGEWIKLEMPHKLVVGYVNVKSRGTSTPSTQSPKDFKILGSNDDINWDILESFTSVPYAITGQNHAVGATKGYKYIAFLVTRIQRTDTAAVVIGELKFYGHKEGDLTRFPEPTRALKYPHILTKNGTGEAVISGTNFTSYAQRGHIIKASSWIASYPPYAVFNGQTNIDQGTVWVGGYNQYGTSHGNGTGGYGGSRNLKTDLGTGGSATSNGEWLYIEMPHKIKVTSTKIVSYDTSPSTGHPPENLIIYGTNDPSSSGGWNVVDNTYASSSSGVPNNTTGKTWTVSTASSPTAYKYFAYVLVKVNNSGTLCHALLSDWQLLGTEEDTGTPAIVGGPFAGKVANFRVYDQYLGDERIQEIYDAQKDEFGHKKSSMTFYKGRVGVGTTEPEGALTVVDEPHALAKFPARAVSADDSYDEGIGHIKLSAADGSGYQAFDGLTSTSWAATPTRHTRLSEEVDFGAWLKIQTPESVSLKKAEIESKPDLVQVGSDINGSATNDQLGRAVACSHDGTRIIAGGHVHSGDQGMVRVYDWNGTTWELIGNQTLTGTANLDKFGSYVAISGDGNIIAVAAPFEHDGAVSDAGAVRVYYLVGSTWTILPDSGSLTKSYSPFVDAFVGSSVNSYLGRGGIHLSYDGRTLLITEPFNDSAGVNRGQVRIYTYDNGAWSQKGGSINGTVNEESFGSGSSMSEDGNHIVLGTSGDITSAKVKVYKWNGTDTWDQKGSDLTYTGNDQFGPVVSISNDGNTIAVGIRDADIADGALADTGGLVHVYHWSGSAWGTPHKLLYNEAVNEQFGSAVKLSGDGKRLIVGAGGENTFSGELFMYKYTGGSWINLQNIDGGTAGHFGYGPGSGLSDSITISKDGSTIVGGELGYNSGFVNSGRIRVFSMPSTIKSIWGSNDDVNWTKITTAPTREEATSNVAGLAFGYDDRLEFKNLDNPNYYKYHAIVADAFTRLKDIKLFGIRNQGSSTLHDGALTLTKNLDVPRIGPPLDADDTPRRDRLVVEYNTSTNPVEDGLVQDTSGRGNDGVMVGSSYSGTDKSLSFTNSPTGTSSAATSYITRQSLGNKESGNFHHSVSLWFKMTTGVSSAYRAIFEIGPHPRTNTKDIALYVTSASTTPFGFASGGNTLLSSGSALAGQVYHIVIVYDGAKKYLYIDGVLNNSAAYTSFDGAQNMTMQIGRNNHANANEGIDGSISNFKMYVGHALEPSEVKTLYDMGRNGSVANPQPLHIATPLYAPGTIVQVESSTKTDTFSTAGASSHPVSPGNDVPGLAVTIHPKFANSRILVSYTVSTGAYGRAYLRIQRKQGGSTTTIAPSVGVPNSTHGKCTTSHSGSGDSAVDSQSFEYYDTIGGTEPITYQIQAWTYHSSYYIYVNRGHSDGQGNNDGTYWARTLSSITAKEVCQ
jgi:hypothetical protein